MLLLDCVLEELLEPVRIPQLGLPQIGKLTRPGIILDKLPIVILNRVIVHQSINSISIFIQHILWCQCPPFYKLLHYRQVILRIEDIKLPI